MSEEENSDLDYSDNEVVRPRKSRKVYIYFYYVIKNYYITIIL